MNEGSPPPARPIPDLLTGRYRIVSRIGIGGMGVVYKARDLQLNRTVAVKALEDRRLHTPGAAGRLRDEALAAASLDHPYICKVFELIEVGDEAFIVMEFVEGETLAAILKRGALPLGQTLQLGREVAEGLAEAHEHGLVHRDVKPSNVMVTPNGHVKLLDFGVAGMDVTSTPGDRTHTGPMQLTRHAGTPQYMAPEQASGGPVTARADLFSLGVVLYECLTGRLPFAGTTTFDYVRHLLQSAPGRLDKLAPDLPSDLVDLVEQCLEKVPASRPESAAAVVASLRRLSDGLTSPGGSLPTVAERRARQRWKLAAAVAACAALVAIVWRLTGGGQDSDAPLRQLRPLVTSSAQEFGSRVSPDGQWISLISSSAGVSQVMLQQIDGGEPRAVTLGRGIPQSQAWSPDGKQLICVLRTDDGRVLQRYPAFFGGAPLQTVTLPANFSTIRILRWIGESVFVEVQGATGVYLGRIDLDGSADLVDISSSWKLDGTLKNVDVRPDGRAVALSISRNGQEDLWTANIDGSGRRNLTDDAFFDRAPLWNGRGDRVIFQSNRGGQIDLWELNPGTGAVLQLTSGELEEIAESTSRDGTVISFQQLSQDAKLWSWTVAGTGTQLTQDALSDYSPVVSADGRWVAFQRSQPTPSKGYAIIDAKLFVGPLGPVPLGDRARAVADGFAASLSADGEWLAYLQTGETSGRTTLQVLQIGGGATTSLSKTAPLPLLSMLPVDWASRVTTWSGRDLYFVDQPDEFEIRRYRAGEPGAGPALIHAAPGEFIRDPYVSADAARLGYLTISKDAAAVHVFAIGAGTDRKLVTLPRSITGLFARGWLGDRFVLVRTLASHDDLSADLEVLLVDPSGATTRAGLITNAFISTTRLHAPGRVLYVTRADAGVHNLYAFSFDEATLRALTQNALPGVTFSGFEPARADTVVGAREERRQDIWLIQEPARQPPGNPAGR